MIFPLMLKRYMVFQLSVPTNKGCPYLRYWLEFVKDVEKCKFVIGHNVSFDNSIVGCELLRKDMPNLLADFPALILKMMLLISVLFLEVEVGNLNGQN